MAAGAAQRVWETAPTGKPCSSPACHPLLNSLCRPFTPEASPSSWLLPDCPVPPLPAPLSPLTPHRTVWASRSSALRPHGGAPPFSLSNSVSLSTTRLPTSGKVVSQLGPSTRVVLSNCFYCFMKLVIIRNWGSETGECNSIFPFHGEFWNCGQPCKG